MISFIAPGKNISSFLKDFLFPFSSTSTNEPFELIVVDDHSTDDSYDKLQSYAEKLDFLKVYRNPGTGKISALNYGYKKCSGRIIKCIDTDDAISPLLFEIMFRQSQDESIFHDATVTDSNLKPIAHLSSNRAIQTATYQTVLDKIISPPRCFWNFPKEVGDKIFPMPANLPFEDVWFAFTIKKYSRKITYFPYSYYSYRQHSNQTFGGISNFSEDKVRFRAERLLKLLPIVQKSPLGEGLDEKIFSSNIAFFKYVAQEKWSFHSFWNLKAPTQRKLKFFFILFFSDQCAPLISLNWQIRRIRESLFKIPSRFQSCYPKS